ncbi:MAG: nucleoside-diphosphate sugar epimerase/dehydratase [Flavobacterium haoranii]
MQEKKKKTFGNSLIYIFSDLVENRFKNIGYLPRWIIICIDISILFLASVVTYFLVSDLTLSFYPTFTLFERYALIIVVNLLCFLVYRTYAGIIRYSSFIDAFRLLFSTFTAFLILVIFNYTYFLFNGVKVFLFPGLIIHFVISFILLLAFRLAVKFLFENYLLAFNKESATKVAIYGADANAVALANALNLETPKRYQLVGFIGDKKSRINKEVLGLPIVNNKMSIAVILRKLKADSVIISDKNFSKNEKLKIVEDCLEYGYKILTLPTVTDWNDKKSVAKSIKKFEIKDLLERNPIELDNNKIAEQLKEKVLLITGAAGSIGSEIVQQVLSYLPAKVILIDQAETPLHHLSIEICKLQTLVEIVPIIADIRDKKIMEHIFATYLPDVVYHAAAYKHVPLMEENPYQAIKTNILGTKNLADISVASGVKRFVMVSTDKAVNPSNVMGASKRIAEIYVQSLFFETRKAKDNSTKFITTRFGNVLGSNGSVVPLFTKQIEEGGPITITHPDIIRYFMTIPEACQLVLEAGAMGNGGEIFIFDMGQPVKIIDLAKKMIRLAGFVPEKEIPIKVVGLRPGEKLYEELLNDSAKTLPTHHEKIMIATENKNDFYVELQGLIEMLEKNVTNLKIQESVAIMKKIVPEFKSMNSIYEQLD